MDDLTLWLAAGCIGLAVLGIAAIVVIVRWPSKADAGSEGENKGSMTMLDPANPLGFTNPLSPNNPVSVNNPFSPTNPLSPTNPMGIMNPASPTSIYRH